MPLQMVSCKNAMRFLVSAATVACAACGAGERARPVTVLANVARDSAVGESALTRLRTAVTAPGLSASLRDALERPMSPEADPLAEAPRLLEEARAAYARIDSAAAREHLQRAEARLLEGEPTLSIAGLAELNLLAALVAAADGRADEAVEGFRLLRRLAPATRLDEGHYLPEVVVLFERAAADEPAGARLTLSGLPANARLWIDGSARAPGSTFSIPAGDHYIAVAAPGARSRAERI